MKLHSPAVARNTAPIAAVLAGWLPPTGTVLELASGGGEHALAFARAFPALDWQPSDPDPAALASIADWRAEEGPPNLREPVALDCAAPVWPVASADALVAINLVHIAPWEAALGLLDGAARLLAPGAPLILYGPWIVPGEALAPSNAEFDRSLKARDPRWGLRVLERFTAEAEARGLELADRRAMPANNLSLRFARVG